MSASPDATARTAQTRVRVLALLRSGHRMPRINIARALEISKGQASRALRSLAQCGLARSVGGGRWEVGS